MDMKTAISLPDPVFRSAERLASRLGVSRSELYCRAIRELLERNDQEAIRRQLDTVYGTSEDNRGLDPGLAALQIKSVRTREKW
jgi:metal-responsive CopG/Arc/MetJ family transcriptional regulator